MVKLMKIMATFKMCTSKLLHSVLLTLKQATSNPRLHQRYLDIQGHVWISVLWGHCSFLLGPDAHKILFLPSKSLFPQSCVSSGGSMVELKVTSSKRVYAIPGLLHPEPLWQSTADPYPHRVTQTQFWLSLCGLGMYFCVLPRSE